MITPYISVRGKVNSGINVKGKIGHATEKVYPELEDLHIIPSGEEQTFKSDDKYGFNEVTVEGISAAVDDDIQPENIRLGKNILGVDGIFDGIDTSDATATANDILEGKTAYVNKEKLEGTIGKYDGSYSGNADGGVVITDGYYLCYNGHRQEIAQQLVDMCGAITNAYGMFYGCKELTELDVSKLNTSLCTNMYYMFNSCKYLTKIDISKLDTSQCTNMNGMFRECSNLTELDVSNFITTNVTTMESMFQSCEKLTSLDVSNFDTSNVTIMTRMFYSLGRSSGFSKLDLSNFKTGNVTSMNEMFNAAAIKELDVSNWDTSNVTNMSYFVVSCYNLEQIKGISDFNTSNVKNLSYMFQNCYKLTSLDLSNWDLSKVTEVTKMLKSCNTLTNLKSFKNLGKGYTQKTNNHNWYTLYVQDSPLTRESLLDIITNGLYDLNLTYDVANGGTLYRQSFQIGTTNMAKLTEEEIQIAIDKGWNVS